MRSPHFNRLGDALIADDATVVGEVRLGLDVSVWYGAVIRGDVCTIEVGARTNVQDLAVIHPMTGYPVRIGEEVTIGHQAVVHCSSVGDRSLIGIGAVLLTGAEVGEDCLVAARATVTEGMKVPPGSVVMGTPARVVRETTAAEREFFRRQAAKYIQLARSHLPGEPPFDWRAAAGSH